MDRLQNQISLVRFGFLRQTDLPEEQGQPSLRPEIVAFPMDGLSHGSPSLIAAHRQEELTDLPHGTTATAFPGHHEDALENVLDLALEAGLAQLGTDDADGGIA